LELNLPMPGESGWWDSAHIAERFHAAHLTAHGHSDSDNPIDLVNLRLAGLGRIERPTVTVTAGDAPYEPRPIEQRPAYLTRGSGFVACNHYDRAALFPGARIRGPALIHQLDSTVLVMAGHSAWALGDGTLAIVAEERA